MAEPAEEGQFELDVGDAEATEVELEQPEEKNVPRGTSEPEPEVEVVEETSKEDSEIEQYSESVQKRINRLTKKMRDAERREEERLLLRRRHEVDDLARRGRPDLPRQHDAHHVEPHPRRARRQVAGPQD